MKNIEKVKWSKTLSKIILGPFPTKIRYMYYVRRSIIGADDQAHIHMYVYVQVHCTMRKDKRVFAQVLEFYFGYLCIGFALHISSMYLHMYFGFQTSVKCKMYS